MSNCEESEDSCGEEEIVAKSEIRTEWLEGILTEYFQERVEILDFTILPKCTSNESVLSDVTHVYIQADMNGPGPLNLVIKQLPEDPFSRFFVTEGQYDLREIKFYTQIVPDMKKFHEKHFNKRFNGYEMGYDTNFRINVPICYHAHYSPAGGTDDSPVPPESILVLNDYLGRLDIKFSKGLTYHQTKAALREIAIVHAHSLCMKVIDKQPLPERYPFLFQKAKATDSYQQLVERGFTQLEHFLKGVPGMEIILDVLMTLRPMTKDIIMSLLAPEGPLALITHTDFWCNNLVLYIAPPGSDMENYYCLIADWQMVAYSKPTNDVALLLVSSLPSKLRREHTEYFLDLYWNILNACSSALGVNIPKDLGYTKEDLVKDYRRSQVLALLLCIGSIDIALGHRETEQRLIDVLQDLYNDCTLTDAVATAMAARNSSNPSNDP